MVFTGKLNFEKGKYYLYNSVSNGFDVPPMEEGTATDKFYLETYILDKTTHPYYIGGMAIQPRASVLQADSLLSEPPGKPSVQFSSVAQWCPTLCNPMNRSTPGLPVHHQLLEFTETHCPLSQ